MNSEQKKVKHLYWRAGCGVSAEYLLKKKFSIADEVEKIFASSKTFTSLEIIDSLLATRTEIQMMSKEEKKGLRHRGKLKVTDLGYRYILNMVEEKEMLREKISLFWMNHFACKINEPFLAQDYLNTIRKNALGNYGDLLREVSKHPAMLSFLNAKQNRKQYPNENFARELMELFTLGRGNYSENDIKEAARSFAGWTFNTDFIYEFKDEFHDFGTKTFLGKTGKFFGDDILNIILEQKQCAYFITKKIYREFVNENHDEEIVQKLAADFFASGYDIEKLMRTIFISKWFYDEKNMGIKIKSPLELIAGMMKTFNLRFENPARFLGMERLMGQELFQPPNVAGWPGGKNWIDNSTLMIRLAVPFVVFEQYRLKLKPKDNFDAKIANEAIGDDNGDFNSDWNSFTDYFSAFNDEQQTVGILNFLLQTNTLSVNKNLFNVIPIQQNKIKAIAIKVMTLPEYQMC